MSKAIINGEVISGSSSSASAVEYTKEDGTKTTVQDELNELNSNLEEQFKKNDDAIKQPINFTTNEKSININTYNSITNCWTCPENGFIRLVSGTSNVSVYITLYLVDDNETSVELSKSFGNGTIGDSRLVQVFKGFKYYINRTSNASAIYHSYLY